jgi:hypothetical protein
VAEHLEAGERGGVELLPQHPVRDDVLDVVGHHRERAAEQVDPARGVAERRELRRLTYFVEGNVSRNPAGSTHFRIIVERN